MVSHLLPLESTGAGDRALCIFLSSPGDSSIQPGLRTTNVVRIPHSRFGETKDEERYVTN